MLKDNVNPKGLNINGLRNGKNGTVVVSASDKTSIELIKVNVEKKLGQDYEVKIPEALRPTIKIIGFSEEMNENDLKVALLKQNPSLDKTKHFEYMGDLPKGRETINRNRIFVPALTDEILRDEVFCQIMRQFTVNQIQISEEREWDLMWLATGVMLPSQPLLKSCSSSSGQESIHCLQRIQKVMKVGRRRLPPYTVEVEAIRYRTVEIYHKVYFPDDTDEAFQIESSTKVADLLQTITGRLELKSSEGFSLFIKIGDMIFSMSEERIQETLPSRTNDNRISCEYQLFFMKKLWIYVGPGKDPNANQRFYFFQEVPKLLQRYYKVTKAEVVELSAYIFADMMHCLVPEDAVRMQKTYLWKKDIISKVTSLKRISHSEVKTEFLKIVCKFPMFGSTFFVDKQVTDQNLPETLLVAINKHGFNLIDSRTKMMAVSSENNDRMPPGRGGTSDVNMLNRICPRTLPWGTPASTLKVSEWEFLKKTWNDLLAE
ncbi:myosin-VIIa-like [Toxorhynchites rutilus septentrionalis]|uniref:myosin-VIIa-like n=1 Tax=Toxorhynchites rutilus septentrionalis TaxID=329112 RepID=UPI00247A8FCD|nr:myosin-VIIa-like [Toxorhynchites rutilus septentrionalis]